MGWIPIPTGLLEQIGHKLQQDRALVADLRVTAETLLADKSYQSWFEGGRLMEEPYVLPASLRDPIEFFGLGQNGVLQAQAQRFLDGVFLTDLPATDKRIRVYPYDDESLRIHECMEERSLYGWPDMVIDVACGCGHHTMARRRGRRQQRNNWPSRATRIALDINDRALAYARINRTLNDAADVAIAQNDIRDRLPFVVENTHGEKALFLVNMPFSLQPLPAVLPLTTDGGRTGAALTFKALEAIKGFSTVNPRRHVRAVVLVYTVGKSPTGDWEVVNKAQELFGNDAVQFQLLTDELMVRIDGLKRFVGPVTIEQFAQKAECRFDVADQDRPAARQGYANLIKTLSEQGWSHVGYGIVYIDLPPRTG